MRNFDDLSEREMLALAISLEEEDERVYADYAEGRRENFMASAAVFEGMREEESGHRRRLIELYQQTFGEHIPLIRRQDVKGFVRRKPVWLVRPLRLDEVRKWASAMEVESRRFYLKAAARASDAGIRQLLDDLAPEEYKHENRAEELEKNLLPPGAKAAEEEARQRSLRHWRRTIRGRPSTSVLQHVGCGYQHGLRRAQGSRADFDHLLRLDMR